MKFKYKQFEKKTYSLLNPFGVQEVFISFFLLSWSRESTEKHSTDSNSRSSSPPYTTGGGLKEEKLFNLLTMELKDFRMKMLVRTLQEKTI